MTRKIKWSLVLIILTGVTVQAQDRPLSVYDSATILFQQRDFVKALYYYDRYYASTNTPDNYGTYYAALSACQAGEKNKAISYLQMSAQVGFDLSAYDHFANNPLTECLANIPEWESFISTFKSKADSAALAVSKIKKELTDKSRRIEKTLLTDVPYWQNLSQQLSPLALSQRIKAFNDFPNPAHTGFWTLYTITVADTLEVPFLLYIPKNYNAHKKTPLYTYLHGAVVNKLQFPEAAHAINGPEANLVRNQLNDNCFILYPLGKRSFGWIYQQEAFETILQEISYVKSLYNIDDNKVFVGGHSNGGTGAFWFATKKPSCFASFFGFNFLPASYGSNTTLHNLDNNYTFFGVSGIADKTFPAPVVENIYRTAQEQGLKWENFFLEGGHLLPFDNKDSIAFIFEKIAAQKRASFPAKLAWETDDIRNGKIDWVEITALDTLAQRAPWHTNLVPTIISENKLRLPFNGNKTGLLKARREGNDVYIETSCVKALKLYIYEGLFDINKPIRVYVNNQLLFNKKVTASSSVMLEAFFKHKDRTQIVLNTVTIPL